MDVLVLWSDGTKNVVCSKELKTYRNKPITVGCRVKMLYDKLWYRGKVIAVEELSESYSSEDDISLIKLKKCLDSRTETNKDLPVPSLDQFHKNISERVIPVEELSELWSSEDDIPLMKLKNSCDSRKSNESDKVSENDSNDEYYNSDVDPPFGTCEVKFCKQEVFAACPRCEILVCFEHLNEDITNCRNHGKAKEILAMETDGDEMRPSLVPGSNLVIYLFAHNL